MCGSGCHVDNTYYACEPNDADTACCPDNNCVYNGVCYDEGTLADIDGDLFDELCVAGSNGEWEETVGEGTTTTVQTTTTTDEGEPTPCVDDGDCLECYEDCRDGFCFDFRPEMTGCHYYDYCQGEGCPYDNPDYCYTADTGSEYIILIQQTCQDDAFACHYPRTCDYG